MKGNSGFSDTSSRGSSSVTVIQPSQDDKPVTAHTPGPSRFDAEVQKFLSWGPEATQQRIESREQMMACGLSNAEANELSAAYRARELMGVQS
jgi:hypothetical protein